jgi:hypothetical protein
MVEQSSCKISTGKRRGTIYSLRKPHRTAAEHNEKGDNPSGNWHNQRALDYSDRAYTVAKKAESKSGKIGSLENAYAL